MSNIPYFLSLEEALAHTKKGTFLFICDTRPYEGYFYSRYKNLQRIADDAWAIGMTWTSQVYKNIPDGVLRAGGRLVEAIIDLRTTKTITPQVEELLAIAGFDKHAYLQRTWYTQVYAGLNVDRIFVTEDYTLTHTNPNRTS